MSKLFEEPLTLTSSSGYTINVLTSGNKKRSKVYDYEEVSASVMQWFGDKGIKAGNPEDIIVKPHS